MKIAATYIIRCEESDGDTSGAQFWAKATEHDKHKFEISRIDQKVNQKMIWDLFCAAFFALNPMVMVPGPSSCKKQPQIIKYIMQNTSLLQYILVIDTLNLSS